MDKVYDIMSWQDVSFALGEKLGCEVMQINQYVSRSNIEMQNLAEFPDLLETPDKEILEQLNIFSYLAGDLYIITDRCYIDIKGVFHTTSSHLTVFVESYMHGYNESFFNCDVFILSPSMGNILFFHHDAFLFLIKMPLIK